MSHSHAIGLGDKNAKFRVYMGNKPDLAFTMQGVMALSDGDIASISKANGNGWRKVFNVYAKLVYALGSDGPVNLDEYSSWQAFRDNRLLRRNSNTALMFCPLNNGADPSVTHIVMGKQFALSHSWSNRLAWVDGVFACIPEKGVWVTPYFDYRQLTNARIIQLVEMLGKG